MSDEQEAPVWEWLKEFGFQADSAVMSDMQPGLSYQFWSLKLSASATVSRSFSPVVLFTGSLRPDRSMSLISFEIPQDAISKALCAAYLCYFLKECTDAQFDQMLKQTDWLRLGDAHQHLLPWVAQLIEDELENERFRQRPQCTVDREWLKLALKDLETHLAEHSDGTSAIMSFDGRILEIRTNNNSIIVPASGGYWPCKYTIPAKNLRQRPKRLMNPQVNVSIWQEMLIIDQYRYPEVTEYLELT